MLNYQTVDFLASQLEDQYNKQVASGLDPYPYQEQLPDFFRAQAAKLAANNVRSIYDVQQADGGIVNAATGEPIKDVVLRPTWKTDPEAYKFRDQVELEERGGGKYTRWGKDLSVTGQGDYGLSFVDNKPVFTPYWKDTQSFSVEDALKTAAAIAAIYYGGQYLLSPETAAAAGAEAGAAGAGTGISGAGLTSAEMAALKGAEAYGAGAGTGMAISGAGLTSAEMAALKGAEAYGPGATSSLLPALKTAGDVARAANLANSLLNPPSVQQQAGLPQAGLLSGGQPRGVDFSPLYQNSMVGLLPLAERYRRSLI